MRMSSKETTARAGRMIQPLAGFIRSVKVSAGILLFATIHYPVMAHGQSVPASYQVKLAWNASTSIGVTGYRVHIGTVSGTYMGSILAGNATTVTIPGLANGVKYYFAVTAINAEALESDFSNETSFLPGSHTTGIHRSPSGAPVLTIRGLIGQPYDIEATQDFKVWTVVGTVTPGDGGSLEFTDPHAANYSKRFYRTRKSP